MFQIIEPLLEPLAVITGLLSVWYSRQRSVLVYPIGLISVCIYIYLCLVHGIYADMGINIFYFVMSLYGWWIWYHKRDSESHVIIESNTLLQNLLWGLVTLPIWYGIFWLLKEHTDSTIPVLDSFTTAGSIVGMILMAERKIENWIYWIVVDAVSIPMFAYKGLYLTSLQFFIFCLLALSGYIAWYKVLQSQRS